MTAATSRTAPDFGALVDCWLEGMRLVTRVPTWSRESIARGAISVLQAALSQAAPDSGDRLAWARDVAQEYYRAQDPRGVGNLSPFAFADWMRSGKPPRKLWKGEEPPPARPAISSAEADRITQEALRRHGGRPLGAPLGKGPGRG